MRASSQPPHPAIGQRHAEFHFIGFLPAQRDFYACAHRGHVVRVHELGEVLESTAECALRHAMQLVNAIGPFDLVGSGCPNPRCQAGRRQPPVSARSSLPRSDSSSAFRSVMSRSTPLYLTAAPSAPRMTRPLPKIQRVSPSASDNSVFDLVGIGSSVQHPLESGQHAVAVVGMAEPPNDLHGDRLAACLEAHDTEILRGPPYQARREIKAPNTDARRLLRERQHLIPRRRDRFEISLRSSRYFRRGNVGRGHVGQLTVFVGMIVQSRCDFHRTGHGQVMTTRLALLRLFVFASTATWAGPL